MGYLNGAILGIGSSPNLRDKMSEPLKLIDGTTAHLNTLIGNLIDIKLRVKGGGHVSQAYAVRQAIAKAIILLFSTIGCEKPKALKNLFLSFDRSLLVADIRRCET